MQEHRKDTSELVGIVKEDSRSKLLDLLDDVPGKKHLVFDTSLMDQCDLIVKSADLKDHGVLKFWRLGEGIIREPGSQMIFLIRCTHVDEVDKIANQILADEKAEEKEHRERSYTVIFVPRKTEQCMQRLKDRNVHANVSVEEFPLYFFPFDSDVLSMELPGVFNEFHVQGDPSSAFYTAKALMALQRHFGVIPQVHSIGPAGKTVVDNMLRLRKEESTNDALKDPQMSRNISQPGVPPVAPHAAKKDKGNTGSHSAISEVILIDRKVDIYSILCSQFTYEAMIDASIGLNKHQVDLSRFSWAKKDDKGDSKLRMSPDEPFYKEIRHLHIDQIGPLLGNRAVAIQEVYKKKDTLKDPSEIKDYMPEFKKAQQEHPLLEKNINLAQHLKAEIQSEEAQNQLRLEDNITSGNSQTSLETIEDYIDEQRPLHEVMRLLCLYSLVNNGVKPKQLDPLKRSLIQSYGFEQLLTFCNAEKVGILRYHQGKPSWSSIKRAFNLFVEGPEAEKDISYAYSGYAPLSVRLVQMTRSLQRGWRSIQNDLSLLWGPAQELQQPLDHTNQNDTASANESSVVLVCFLGGVTYGEIAALRRLSELEDGRRKFLIVTTEFLNAKKFFESIRCEQIFNQSRVEVDRAKAPQQQASRGFGFWPGGR